MASGIDVLAISRAMSPSPGGNQCQRDKGRLKPGTRGSSRMAAIAPAACRRCVALGRRGIAATLSISSRVDTVCSACQRLKASLSFRRQEIEIAAVEIGDSLIGAESCG